MPTHLKSRCPHCQAVIKVTDSHVGKRVRCPSCKQSFEVSSVELALSNSASLDRAPAATETLADAPSDTPASSSPLPLGEGQDEGAHTNPKRERGTDEKRLGRFLLKELLGQGAFGKVFKAYDPQLDRFVALKVPTFGPDEKHKVNRFLAEAKTAAKLRHPNIVPTYESGQIDGQYYIASQFVSGQPLSRSIKSQESEATSHGSGATGILPVPERGDHSPPTTHYSLPPQDFRQIADWVRQLADALAYAHKEGIVHRDIKPDNIMLDEQSVPQIMDFGLAKRLNEDSALTTDGSLLGTPAYMSPEQARGDHKSIGPLSDQYSLGVVLYELLTLQKPFDGSPHAVIAKVLSHEPASPRSLKPSIPRDLDAICQKAMSKEDKSRYTTCSNLSDDLSSWLRGDGTLARPIRLRERFYRWTRREPRVAALSITAAVLLIIGAALTTTLAVIAQRNSSRLTHLLNSLTAQTERASAEAIRASQAERLAEQRAADAIAQKNRADTLASDASARAAELAKALGELDSAKLAAIDASELATTSAREKHQSDYRANLAEANRALNEGRLSDALDQLDNCPVTLRDAVWSALYDQAKNDFRMVPLDPVLQPGRVYLSSRRDIAVIDSAEGLGIVTLDKPTTNLHRHSKQVNRLSFFAGPYFVIITEGSIFSYDYELNRYDYRANVNKPLRMFASLSIPAPLISTTNSLPRDTKFSSAVDHFPYVIYYRGDVGVDTPAIAASLLGEKAWHQWDMGIIKSFVRPTNHYFTLLRDGRSANSVSNPGPMFPIAVDLYGPCAIFKSRTNDCYLERRLDRSPVGGKTDSATWTLLPEMRLPTGVMSLASDALAFNYADSIEIWDLKSKGERKSVLPVSRTISLVAVSPDGSLVATYDRSQIEVRDTATGRMIRVFTGHVDVENLEFDRGLERVPNSPVLVGTQSRTRLAWVSKKGLCIWEMTASSTATNQSATPASSSRPSVPAAKAPTSSQTVNHLKKALPKPKSSAVVDLLNTAERDLRSQNGITRDGSEILTKPEGSHVGIRVDFPEEYVVEMDVIREQGINHVALGFEVQGKPLTAIIDGSNSRRSGLASINDQEVMRAHNASLQPGALLQTGKQSTIRIEVTKHAIDLSVNGRTICNWPFDPNAKTGHAAGVALDPGCFVVYTPPDVIVRVSRLELWPTTTSEQVFP